MFIEDCGEAFRGNNGGVSLERSASGGQDEMGKIEGHSTSQET